ncbi:Cadherin-23 [Portunus trituberculatus]|uniref:Cadherin-23 n=1 Tax=Portunus trituberculatus TaxID=210409 RepID=A0A5B7E7C3_PORTR|nr:Cadherin-23 [Portunus trituberculatus]
MAEGVAYSSEQEEFRVRVCFLMDASAGFKPEFTSAVNEVICHLGQNVAIITARPEARKNVLSATAKFQVEEIYLQPLGDSQRKDLCLNYLEELNASKASWRLPYAKPREVDAVVELVTHRVYRPHEVIIETKAPTEVICMLNHQSSINVKILKGFQESTCRDSLLDALRDAGNVIEFKGGIKETGAAALGRMTRIHTVDVQLNSVAAIKKFSESAKKLMSLRELHLHLKIDETTPVGMIPQITVVPRLAKSYLGVTEKFIAEVSEKLRASKQRLRRAQVEYNNHLIWVEKTREELEVVQKELKEAQVKNSRALQAYSRSWSQEADDPHNAAVTCGSQESCHSLAKGITNINDGIVDRMESGNLSLSEFEGREAMIERKDDYDDDYYSDSLEMRERLNSNVSAEEGAMSKEEVLSFRRAQTRMLSKDVRKLRRNLEDLRSDEKSIMARINHDLKALIEDELVEAAECEGRRGVQQLQEGPGQLLYSSRQEAKKFASRARITDLGEWVMRRMYATMPLKKVYSRVRLADMRDSFHITDLLGMERQRQPPIVILSGPKGSGKTCMAHYLLQQWESNTEAIKSNIHEFDLVVYGTVGNIVSSGSWVQYLREHIFCLTLMDFLDEEVYEAFNTMSVLYLLDVDAAVPQLTKTLDDVLGHLGRNQIMITTRPDGEDAIAGAARRHNIDCQRVKMCPMTFSAIQEYSSSLLSLVEQDYSVVNSMVKHFSRFVNSMKTTDEVLYPLPMMYLLYLWRINPYHALQGTSVSRLVSQVIVVAESMLREALKVSGRDDKGAVMIRAEQCRKQLCEVAWELQRLLQKGSSILRRRENLEKYCVPEIKRYKEVLPHAAVSCALAGYGCWTVAHHSQETNCALANMLKKEAYRPQTVIISQEGKSYHNSECVIRALSTCSSTFVHLRQESQFYSWGDPGTSDSLIGPLQPAGTLQEFWGHLGVEGALALRHFHQLTELNVRVSSYEALASLTYSIALIGRSLRYLYLRLDLSSSTPVSNIDPLNFKGRNLWLRMKGVKDENLSWVKEITAKLNDWYTEVLIYENVNSGFYVHRVEAVDLDAQPRLRYSLDPQNSEARNEEGAIVKPTEYNYMSAFEMNEVDGVIRTVIPLDREQVEMIRLGLICEDLEASTEKQTATATLTILIEDTNDNDPEFRKPYYRRSLAENSKKGTTVASVVADDIDKNRTITYSMQGPKEVLSLVQLDRETGEIVVVDRVDREQFAWLNFSVEATDSGVPPRSSFVDVVVQVIDENDNNPTFINPLSNLTIREDAPPGTSVTTVTATDPDSDDYGLVTYLLDRKSSYGKFEIDPDTGVITVASALNREERSTYNLLIEAWDNYQFGYATGESRNAFMQLGVTVADINDEVPVFEEREECTMITEFHRPRETITVVRATDGDDINSPNGRILFSIEGGNEKGLFEIRNIEKTAAEIYAAKPLVAQYGNYSLQIQAQDRGFPPNSVLSHVNICVLDFNDHAPEFVSPSENVTIKVPENATVGSLVIQVRATDQDIGINGAVRYRILKDGLGNWQTFTIDQTTGAILLQKPLDRERQKLYEIRVEAYDQGTPTPLSNDLDLAIYVRNVNDYEPQFVQDEVVMNFTEHKSPRAERFKLVDTVDLDDVDEENTAQVCYFIVGGDEYNTFNLDRFTHEIMAVKELDREVDDHYTLLVKATEDCLSKPEPVSFFDPRDDTLLKVHVFVNDINDNPPKFTREVFTGGITTASDFGLQVMRLTAYDPDAGENSRLRYYMDGRVQETLSENLDNVRRSPFLVDPVSGIVKLNFDPQKGMKGYFDFKELNVLDTQRAELITAGAKEEDLLFLWLVGVIVFLTLLLVLTVALCLSQKARYSRRLKAATATAFGECFVFEESEPVKEKNKPHLTRATFAKTREICGTTRETCGTTRETCNTMRETCGMTRETCGTTRESCVLPRSYHRTKIHATSRAPTAFAPNRINSLRHDVVPWSESSTVGSNTQLMNNEHPNINDTYRANLYQTFHKIANPLVDKKLETTEL